MKQTALLFAGLILITFSAKAQFIPEPLQKNSLQNNSTGFSRDLKDDARSFYETSVGLLNSPFNFDEDDLVVTGLILSATAFSFTFDNPVRNNISKLKSPGLDKFSKWGENFGNGVYVLGLSGVLYLGGHIFTDDELRKTGLMLSEAIILNGIVTTGLKVIFGRSRPFRNNGNTKIDFLEMEFEDVENSLPSGHTSTAFTVATVLSNRIDNPYATIALYSLAGLTAFQRMYADKHWFSDTIMGAALGTVIGLKIIKLNGEDKKENESVNFNVSPVLTPTGYGVGFVFNF